MIDAGHGRRRAISFGALLVFLILGFTSLISVDWQSGSELHTLLEAAATLIAFIVGTLSLTRHYSDKSNKFLLIGCGFLGVGFLDGYHAVATSNYFAPHFSINLETLYASSWTASRVFLSTLLCWSWFAAQRERREGAQGQYRERYVYAGVTALALASFLLFASLPLPRGYFPHLPFHRPEEFVSAILFTIALVAYVRSSGWRKEGFEYWLVLSLIVAAVSQAIFTPYSAQLFDPMFDAGHVLKVISYLMVLIGLLVSVSRLIHRVEENEEILQKFVDNAPAMVAMLDQNLQYLRVSRQWLRGTNLIGQNVIGRHMYDIFPNTPDEWKQVHQRCLAGAVESRKEDLFKRPDGSNDWIRWEIHPWYRSSGEVGGVIMFIEVITERKEAEAQLRRYENIVNTSSYLMSFISPDYKYLTINDAYVEWTGLPREEILGKTSAALFGADTFERIHKPKIDQVLAGKSEVRNSGWFDITKRGRRFLSVIYRPQHDENGDLTGVAAIARDETARAIAEEELRQYQHIVSTSRDLLALIGTDYRVRAANESYAAFYGRSVADVIGIGIWELAGREFFETSIKDRVDRCFAGEDIRYEAWFPLPVSGRLFLDVHYHPYREADGSISGAVLSARDVTQRARTEEALEKSEARTRAVVDTVADGIITIDEKGTIQSVNPATVKIFGFDVDEMIGSNVSGLASEPYRSAHDRYLQNYMETGDAKIIGVPRELEGCRKSGEIFSLELSVTELNMGEERLFVGVIRDITDRKEAERTKNEFLSTVSHELRTPLTSIRGSLGLLTAGVGGELGEKGKTLINLAEKNTLRLINMVNDLLDIEKIEAGKMEFNFTPIDLSQLTEQAAESNSGYAQEHNVVFEVIQKIPGATVLADEGRLTQVVSNLLSNAAKFSPEGETIDISVEKVPGRYRVSVVDRGPGVPKADRGKIFERFTQVDSSDRRAVGGTGLGLNISKAIVERHGGSIGLDSNRESGSKFYFDIPQWSNSPHENEPGILDFLNSTESSTSRVLVVEDDPDVASVLSLMLQNGGYQTDIAHSAEAAKTMLARNTYDALTIDLILPGQGGLSLLGDICENPATRDLRAVVISATISNGDEKIRASAAGIIDVLGKPVDQNRLLRAIESATSGKTAGGGKPQILYVEDDADFIAVMSALLSDIATVIPARTLAAANNALESHSVDLVIIDINLPDGSGLDLVPNLKSGSGSSIPSIVFSGSEVSGDEAENVNAAFVKAKTSNEAVIDAVKNLIGKKSKEGE